MTLFKSFFFQIMVYRLTFVIFRRYLGKGGKGGIPFFATHQMDPIALYRDFFDEVVPSKNSVANHRNVI